MRLFTGLSLPDEVIRHLDTLLTRLRPTAEINWSPIANLHITTKFIGEWKEPRLAELQSALAALPPRPPISVHVSKLGFYPNPRSPRVFWCGIEAPGLDSLAAETDDATAGLGIDRENRAYSPHLTLARIKDRPDLRKLQEAIAELPSVDFGRFEAASFFLYRSHLSPTGSVYTKLSEFPFTKK